MKRKPDYEGEILKLGWNTESTSSNRMMAERGGFVTGWHDSWEKVLAAIKEMKAPECVLPECPIHNGGKGNAPYCATLANK